MSSRISSIHISSRINHPILRPEGCGTHSLAFSLFYISLSPSTRLTCSILLFNPPCLASAEQAIEPHFVPIFPFVCRRRLNLSLLPLRSPFAHPQPFGNVASDPFSTPFKLTSLDSPLTQQLVPHMAWRQIDNPGQVQVEPLYQVSLGGHVHLAMTHIKKKCRRDSPAQGLVDSAALSVV